MKVIILFFISLLLTGCGHDPYKIPDDVNIILNDNVFEVFDTIEVNDLIKSSNVEVFNHSIKSEKTGDFVYTINFEYNGKSYKKDINYTIVDTIPPVFISYYGSSTILVNQDINPCNDAIYADNYDSLVTCVIEGEYDLTKPGTYKLNYLLTDSSKNVTKKKLTLNVVRKYKKNNSSSSSSTNSKSSKNNMKDIIKKYKNDNTMIGIDVSRWQGEIDYEKVKNSGIEFVMMRIGVNSSSNGPIDIDSYYLTNIQNAKSAGLKVGVYLYSTATNVKTAYDHAMWVINTLDGIELDFPIAYDWENWKWFMEYEISLYTLSECFNIFAKTVENYGYSAMLYSSKFYLENIWINYKNYPVWLAHYTEQTDYDGDFIMWQFTSKGKVEGINGDVDINIYYKEKN